MVVSSPFPSPDVLAKAGAAGSRVPAPADGAGAGEHVPAGGAEHELTRMDGGGHG
jgi:hypothetical protein